MAVSFSRKRLLYVIYLLVIVPLLLEVALRLYNPFNLRIKGDKILLQANKEFIIHNETIPVIDSLIIHRKNALGMRGPNKPDSFNKYLSIISVGGSTTECGYITEGKTWSDRLAKKLEMDFPAVWVNNAGLAGHSTFGHAILLQDYLVKLRPKVILFLVGCNDMLLDSLRPSETSNLKGHYATFFTFLTKNSELCSLLANLWRMRVIQKGNLNDNYYDLSIHKNDNLVLPDDYCHARLETTKKFLPAYRARLNYLLDLCKKYEIRPVLITQPAMYGEGLDEATGTDLAKVKHNDQTSGLLWWSELQLYNQVTIEVGNENHIAVINLATALPKGSKYFYDYVHFTNEGNEKVSQIIHDALVPYFTNELHFPRKGN